MKKVYFIIFLLVFFILTISYFKKQNNNLRKQENSSVRNKIDLEFENTYKELKLRYLMPAGENKKRVLYDPEENNSDAEVNAYFMNFAVYENDKETFDQIWNYEKQYINKNGVISWLINADGSVSDENSALDSTEDIACALILADMKWGGYKEDALNLLEQSLKVEIENETYIPKAGDWGGGSVKTNPSYFDPADYILFKNYSGDKNWLKVNEASMKIFKNMNQKIQDKEMVMYPDWVDSSGSLVSDNSARDIGYDTTRIAIRQMKAIRLLKGEDKQNAREIMEICNNFYKSIIIQNDIFNIENLKDGYSINGNVSGYSTNTAFRSAAAVAAQNSDDHDYKDKMLNELFNVSTDYPFNAYMKLNALLVLSSKLDQFSSLYKN